MHTTVAASAVQMTLYVELYDSVSNQMIGKVMDPETPGSAPAVLERARGGPVPSSAASGCSSGSLCFALA